MQEQTRIIVAENVHKWYGKFHVLKGADLIVNRGEVVVLMGPSGSGKSTLLHILGFLSDHTAGEYRFNGKRFEDHTDDEVAHIRNTEMGFVFQFHHLLPIVTRQLRPRHCQLDRHATPHCPAICRFVFQDCALLQIV